MNPNLSRLGQQLAGIWSQLGVPQRMSVILATTVVFGSLAGLVLWSSRVDYALLYGRLSDAESAKVITALDEAKIPYQVARGGSAIMVPADKVHVMRMQLAGRGIPRGDGVGFEIFDKPNFGISDFVQRANYVRAIQGELARTISQLDEIEAARVMIVLPENRLLMDKDKHPTASVFVRVRGNTPLNPPTINSIRFLVANSVEGLKPNFVSVVDNQGNVLSENVEDDSLVGLTTTQLAARRNLEQYLAKKAEGMLEKVLGPGQAIVRVSADINFDTTTRTEEKFDPEGQVVRTQTKDEEDMDTTSAEQGRAAGLPSAATLESNDTQVAASPMNTTRNKKTTSTMEYEISKTTSSIMQAAGGLRRISAAVTVAAKVEGTAAAPKVLNRTPEELEKLRRIVESALGLQIGSNGQRNDQITLEELPFNREFAAEVTRELGQQQRHDFWISLGRNLVYPVLAIAVLIFFVRLFRKTEEIPIGIPVGQLSSKNGNGNGHSKGLSWPGEPQPELVSVEVLNRLIKENPASMTQAIRTWLNRPTTPPPSS